ncbi:MAG: tetratricopeptide repeat protein [Lachnospiraceae bacterium]|nr:tetratricopeptide repeat protein [Lachnospiraceae bacterium]
MDRYEYKVKFQEINNLIDEKEYFEAAAIADTIDWEKKPVETLVRIGDLYRKVMRYDDAIELLRLAYRKSPENKNICYYLCKLYIKKEYIVQAVYAYNEFERIARPNDPRVYKLKYMRDQMLHVEMAQKIATLETLKNIEYTEKWAYTLAYQYYLDGRESDCVRECDELIAAFGDGKYVYAAMLLKKKYTELTPEQQKIFDNWKEETEETENSAETENAESAESTESSEGTEADQSYEYATREIPGDDTRRIPQEDAGSTRTITAEEIGQIREATAPEETIVYDPAQVMMALEKTNLSDETRIFKGINIPEEPEIRVKTVDVGQFNTIDLQKALSASVREVVGEAAYANTDVTKAIMAPMLDPDTGSLDDPEYAEASQKEYEYNTDEITADEAPDTFTETSEMSAEEIASDADDSKETTPDATTFISFNTGEYPAFDATVQDAADEQDEKDRLVTEEGSIKSYYPKDMSVYEQLSETQMIRVQEAIQAQPPESIANELSQGNDGQISLVLPDDAEITRQITGQMDIAQVMEEWNRRKEEFGDKLQKELHNQVKVQTGELFDHFETEILNSLLEVLERESEEEAAASQAVYEGSVKEFDDLPDEARLETGLIPVQTIAEITEKNADEEAAKQHIRENQERIRLVGEDESIRDLTREEKELFGPYIQSRAAKRQLAVLLDSLSMASYTGNAILAGDDGIDVENLAVRILKEVRNSDHNLSGKVAKIKGENLNGKNMDATMKLLAGGGLIISDVAAITEETVENLKASLMKEDQGMIVILADRKRNIEKFMDSFPTLCEMFTAYMEVRALSEKKLVAFAKKYAREREYVINEMGELALHTQISLRQSNDHAVTVMEVKQIVDDAIKNVEKKTPSHFFDILLGKRYDIEDMIILGERDFA